MQIIIHVFSFLIFFFPAKTSVPKVVDEIDEIQTLYSDCHLKGVVNYDAFKQSFKGYQEFHLL